MKHVYMLFAAIALEVTGTTFMKFSVPRNAGGHGLFVLLLKQGG